MEVGLGSLSPEHRAELARARMTVVPIPRGLGQSSSGGSGNVPTPPGGWIQPISSEGISGPVPATAAAAVIVNMPGVQPTTNAQGTGPAGCPAGSALRLVYASPTVKQKLNLAPVHVQGGLSQQQLQAIYGAYVLNFSLLPANANPGSTYPLQTPLSFTYNGLRPSSTCAFRTRRSFRTPHSFPPSPLPSLLSPRQPTTRGSTSWVRL
jgi:hypothetical protein